MHRFFLSGRQFKKTQLVLEDAQEIHHLKNVLRLKKGSEVQFFNGKGQSVIAIINAVTQVQVRASIKSVEQALKIKPKIILACAIPKKAKFEFILEKCIELGVDEVIPLCTKRTEVVYDQKKAFQKAARFRSIAINAAKQCKRDFLPVIHEIRSFTEVLSGLSSTALCLIPWLEGERESVLSVFQKNQNIDEVVIFIGPEGDFSSQEVRQAKEKGAIPISLGKTTLKVDTAAIAVVSIANFFYRQ